MSFRNGCWTLMACRAIDVANFGGRRPIRHYSRGYEFDSLSRVRRPVALRSVTWLGIPASYYCCSTPMARCRNSMNALAASLSSAPIDQANPTSMGRDRFGNRHYLDTAPLERPWPIDHVREDRDTHADRDHAPNRFDRRRAKDRVGPVGRLFPVSLRRVARLVDRQHYVRLRGNFLKACGRLLEKAMVRTDPESPSGPQQGFVRDFLVIRNVRGQHHGQIEAAGDKAFFNRAAIGFDHVDPDIRECPGKSGEMNGNEVAGDGIADRKIERAPHVFADASREANGFFDRCHNVPGMVEKEISFISQGHAIGVTFEQGRSDHLFQSPDRICDGGLGDIDIHRSLRNLTGVGRCDEVTKLAKRRFHLLGNLR